MAPLKADDWSAGLHREAAQFLKSVAKKVAILVANAGNMDHFRARITEFAEKWTKYKVAKQADQEGNWQPSMGIHDNPLGAIWPTMYVQQPAGHGAHFPAGPRDVPNILGDYALLQAIHDHVLPNCQRIDASGVLCEPSDEIWQNVVTFAEGESGSKGYVNTGLIDRAMENVTADLETWRTGNEEDAAKGSGQQLDIQALIERLRLLQSALEDASGDADRIRSDLKVFVGSADRLYDALQEPLRGSTADALERLAWIGAARKSRQNTGLHPALLDTLAVPEFIAELENSWYRLNRTAVSTASTAAANDRSTDRATAESMIKTKEKEGKYDVFLSHNSKDKAAVEEIARRLKGVGIRPWFDRWDLIPGETLTEALEKAITDIKCAALFFGPADVGRWHVMEIRAYIESEAAGEARFIPVILPGVKDKPKLPMFVRQALWVDMREWKEEGNDTFDRLACGIIGRLPGELPPGGLTARDVFAWQNRSR